MFKYLSGTLFYTEFQAGTPNLLGTFNFVFIHSSMKDLYALVKKFLTKQAFLMFPSQDGKHLNTNLYFTVK